MVTFSTTLLQLGNNVGIEVPEDIVLGFGVGKRVPVIVTIAGYSYPSTTAVMGGSSCCRWPRNIARRAVSPAARLMKSH